MYATHDGNVYKNTGSGWSSYNNGNWNSVNSSANSKTTQQQKQSYENSSANRTQSAPPSETSRQTTAATRTSGSSEVDRASQNRERGAAQSQRFQQANRSGGGRRR
jgi:hypothetical protein